MSTGAAILIIFGIVAVIRYFWVVVPLAFVGIMFYVGGLMTLTGATGDTPLWTLITGIGMLCVGYIALVKWCGWLLS